MAKLVYTAMASLDGFVADEHGGFDWAAPDDDVHARVNDVQRDAGTLILGRRMYDVLAAWEDLETEGAPKVVQDFAQIWRGQDKVVYSKTLDRARTSRTRLVRDFDADELRRLKVESARDLAIGGPHVAALAFEAGLVDEIHLYLLPVLVGGGNAALGAAVKTDLELIDIERFSGGAVHLHHRVRRPGP